MIKFNVEDNEWKSLNYNYDILCLDNVVKQKRLLNRVVDKVERANERINQCDKKTSDLFRFELKDILHVNFLVSTYFNKNINHIIKKMLSDKDAFNKLIEQIIIEILTKRRDEHNNTTK